MENAAAAFTDRDYITGAYTRLDIAGYWKRWAYEHATTAGMKLAGLLNEHVEEMQERIHNIQNQPGPAGGGTTTGAGQLNPQIQAQLQALEEAYAATGQWSYPADKNPLKDWQNEPRL